MEIIKNNRETKQVRITINSFQVIACYAQLTTVNGQTMEDLIQLKEFKTIKGAQKWALKTLND